MRISRLIELLQQIQAERGCDLFVETHTAPAGWCKIRAITADCIADIYFDDPPLISMMGVKATA